MLKGRFYYLLAFVPTNVPIQRVFVGKKTPFLYVIVSSSSKGHSGGKRPQSTPVRGPLKGFKIVQLQSNSDTISIRILRPFPKLFPVKFGLKVYPFQGSKPAQVCFCLKDETRIHWPEPEIRNLQFCSNYSYLANES